MSASEHALDLEKKAGIGSAGALLLTFISAIFTSAFLLFAVQPMFSKMVLPLLGGSPGVWSVAMVVFQSLLLAGYGYAHLSTKYLSLKVSALVHVALYLVAAFFLPLAVNTSLGDAPTSGQEFWLAGVFLLSVGLPFFAVSANGPLLQNWFSRSSHPTAQDPYYLYGASNLGSFASLILYPVLFEPLLTLKVQTTAWATGFGVLGLLLGLCAMMVAANPGAAPRSASEAKADAPSFRTVLGWIGLAFVPSGMLVAVTAHISTDVAAAPFLWVLPLALYLASFVFMFRDRPPVSMHILSMVTLLLAVVSVRNVVYPVNNMPLLSVALQLILLGAVTFMCHGRMYEQRPKAEHLTTFYLWMSFGGVLGGAFCGLAAPALFNSLAEYPLLILASLACIPAIHEARARDWLVKFAPWVVAALAIGFVITSSRETIGELRIQQIVTGLVLIGVVLYRRPMLTAGACAAIVTLSSFGLKDEITHRSFFGIHRISTTDDGAYRQLSHGTTLHGSILIKPRDGSPLPARPEATTYYHPAAAMAEGLRSVQTLGSGQRYGVVGLGAGAMVCNGREGDSWTYYEIDPIVAKIAQDPNQFRYLSVCAPETKVVLGDARLTLARETQNFDALIVDAFSSDAIPVHLLTREAVAMYLDRVSADGLVMIHISNRHMELESVLGAIANGLGISGQRKLFDSKGHGESANSSHVVALARSEAALARLEAQGWTPLKDKGTTAWTDDYSNIIGAIWRHYTR
jgi:hypothetical protein